MGAQHELRGGVYIISVAAELSGAHPQTLRVYERRGLISPARSAGGARRYSDVDLARLAHICELTEAGVNLCGVARVLELEKQLRTVRASLAELRAASGER